ncbi:hypothetical protein U9M48_012322 [Paspalum notatum var. saurae]|uniref:Uncharacterized protein n=1 Tax=Paspalum notatum var. saurae TaxID=547442 RepID=A0AAQ3SXC1_PASNO
MRPAARRQRGGEAGAIWAFLRREKKASLASADLPPLEEAAVLPLEALWRRSSRTGGRRPAARAVEGGGGGPGVPNPPSVAHAAAVGGGGRLRRPWSSRRGARGAGRLRGRVGSGVEEASATRLAIMAVGAAAAWGGRSRRRGGRGGGPLRVRWRFAAAARGGSGGGGRGEVRGGASPPTAYRSPGVGAKGARRRGRLASVRMRRPGEGP